MVKAKWKGGFIMTSAKKRAAILLSLALTVFSSTVWAQATTTTPVKKASAKTAATTVMAKAKTAPDFMVQVPYTGNGEPVPAQQDFYLHVNAGWLKNTKLKPYEAISSAFSQADDKVQEQMTELTQKALKHQAAGRATPDEQKVANLYACILDKEGRNKTGLGNLVPVLKRIEAVHDLQGYAETMADICKHNQNVPTLVGNYEITNDPINNDRYVVAIKEPHVSLSREQVENEKNEQLFGFYRDHIRDILHLYGRDQATATKTAQDIFNLQKDLALHSQTIADKADPSKSSSKLNLKEVKKLYTHLDAEKMLNAAGVGPKNGIKEWYVGDKGQIDRVNALYTPQNLPLLKEYGIYALLSAYGNLLTEDYQNATNNFEKLASGTETVEAPERQNLKTNSGLLNQVYGRLYASTYFGEDRKQEVKSYLQLIMDEYRKKLEQLDWMSPATKKKALLKLDKMDINIGYPEAWPEYIEQLQIKAPGEGGSLINNVLSMGELVSSWERDKVGKPVRKDLWEDMMPQTINAGYNPTDNSINFPAGILQAPFYDTKADRETNLGGIGMVIAHEITHCFDNNGAQFDELGRLRNWWTPADYAEFKKRQAGVVSYYNRFMLPDGKHVQGAQTLSENIADLGSLSCLSDIVKDDSQGLRRMYTNFAVIWRSKMTDAISELMLEDIHSLPYIRVDGVLSSTDAFYKVFDVKPGDAMYVAPELRAKLW